MKEKTVFYKSSAAATALFVLGNSVIIMPAKSADEYTFLGFIVAAIIGTLAVFILNPLADFLANEQQTTLIKIIKVIIFSALSLSAAFFAASTFTDFTEFIREIILPQTPKAVIILIFLLAVVFFALKRQEDTLKFALLCCGFSVVAIIFFFFATLGNFDMRNIFIFRLPGIKEFSNSVLPYLSNVVSPILLLPFYRVFVFGNKRATACVHGAVLGFILLGLCILSSVLLFSPQLAGKLDYPYAAAISTITVGKLFTRMDGFSYFLYFSAAIIKINICIYVSITAMKKIKATF